jgi:hypothetical protein
MAQKVYLQRIGGSTPSPKGRLGEHVPIIPAGSVVGGARTGWSSLAV